MLREAFQWRSAQISLNDDNIVNSSSDNYLLVDNKVGLDSMSYISATMYFYAVLTNCHISI